MKRVDSRVLTLKQPWADLIMAGVKDVENRTWPVPSTLPHHYACDYCEYQPIGDDDGLPCSTCGRYGLRPDGPFPFRLWIHAGKRPDPNMREVLIDLYGDREYHTARSLPGDRPDRYGVLLGHVTVTGCHQSWRCVEPDRIPFYPEDPSWSLEATCSPRWADPDYGVWHWTLTDPVPLDEPIPLKGRQGLWRLPEGVA